MIKLFPPAVFGVHYTSVVLDESGRVFAHEKAREFFDLLNDRNIRFYYNIPDRESFSRMFQEKRNLESVLGLSYLRFTEKKNYTSPPSSFASDLPATYLMVTPLAPYYYLGIIALLANPAHRITAIANPVVYTDRTGAIRGFNEYFSTLSQKKDNELLDHPLEQILTGVKPYRPEDPVLPLELTGKLAWEKETEIDLAGRAWKIPPGAASETLEIRAAMDFRKWNYKIEISLDSEGPFIPGVYVMADPSHPDFADNEGYHCTFDPIHNLSLIKKIGDVRQANPVDPAILRGQRLITVRKVDEYVSYSVDDRLIIDFLDKDMLEPTRESGLLLSLLPSCACRLRALGIYRCARRLLPVEPAVRAGFRNRPEETFHVQQTCCHFHGKVLWVYQLINMTPYYSLLSSHRRVVSEKEVLEKALYGTSGDPEFIGESAAVRKILDSLETYGNNPMTITIEGETGTGKEVLARTIHRCSSRREGPFVKLDCSTLPATLMESELFGHEKGAFTGAAQARTGRLEQAHGGTLFLDEIGNLSPETQAKFLDFLQSFEITRVGGTGRKKLDVKVIVAANRPLSGLARTGAFREDLYYRISQINLRLPPLRERADDIPLLARHFMEAGNLLLNKQVRSLSDGAIRRLVGHPWPGNVRELKNVIFLALVNARGGALEEQDIRFPASGGASNRRGEKRGSYARLSREAITEALKTHHGNIRAAARALNIGRTTVYRKLKGAA